jgi:hypothetical protein
MEELIIFSYKTSQADNKKDIGLCLPIQIKN